MLRILNCGRAVFRRRSFVSNTYSFLEPTSTEYRWKDVFSVVSRTKVHGVRNQKFVRHNLPPKISASYVESFTQNVHNVETTINKVLLEKVREMVDFSDFDSGLVEKQVLQELYHGSVDLDVVFYVVKQLLNRDYLPVRLIDGALNMSLDNFDNVVKNPNHAAELMVLAFVCSSVVPDSFLLNMQNYLNRNIRSFDIKHIACFFLAFQKCRFAVTYSLNQKVVNLMVENMSTLHHNEILQIFKSLMISNYYDKNGVEKIAKSLLDNNKIRALVSDQHLQVYLRFFLTRHYYNEVLYDSFLQSFYSLVTTLKITNIKASSLILSDFGNIQFKPKNKIYRNICEILEKICLDARFKPAHFSNSDFVSEFASGMIFFGFFSDDLLSMVFSSIHNVPENKLKRQQYLFLHYSILIEHPRYNGPTIPAQLLKAMEINPKERLRWELKADKEGNLETIYNVLLDMLGRDYVHWHHILPHFTISDIEIRLKEDGSVVAFEPETYTGTQPVSSDLDENAASDITKIVIMHLNQNAFLNGSPEIRGRTQVKIRQLQILGYHILTISKDELLVLPTQQERIDFMTDLIESNFDVKLKLLEKKKKSI